MKTKRALPLVLKLNALSSAATGLLMATLAPVLAAPMGLSAALLRIAGVALLPFAAAVLYVARDPRPSRVKLVSLADFSWVAGSVAVVALMPVTPIGIALVLAVAVVVDVFGTLQLLGLRDVPVTA